MNDKLHELNETVQISLGEPTLATLVANAVHTLTIQDDDALPKVSFQSASSSAFELIGLDLVPVVLSAATSETVIVNYSVTAGGTASAADFVLPAGTLTFAPGETTKNIPLEFVDDGLPESGETVKISLTLPANRRYFLLHSRSLAAHVRATLGTHHQHLPR